MCKYLYSAWRNLSIYTVLIGMGLASGLPLSALAADDSQSERLDALEKQISQVSANASARRPDEGVPLHGFYDVGFATNNNGKYGSKGFNVGSFDLYLTPQFGDRVKSLVELIFEVEADGSLATDMERVQLGYIFGDEATLWAGRFHSPFGYWNTAFHHGAQIQTSIRRPKFIDFEDKGGIMPSHMTGAWLIGKIPAGAGNVNYDLYGGNGPQLIQEAPDLAGINSPAAGSDDNHQAFTGFNLGYNFTGAADGLRLGTHGFKGDVNDSLGNVTDVGMNGLYGTYITDDWEILTEYYHFSNKVKKVNPLTGTAIVGSTNPSNAWFAQAAKSFGQWIPFVRLEKASLNQDDPYFFNQISGASYSRQAVGLRYDLNGTSAIKLELDRTKFNGTNADTTVIPGDKVSEAIAQWSVRF
ncbi:MAG: hypothetical protein ABL858_09535 [Candidatus Nitrotoga sp.]